jgi:virginiamycin B lyase
MRQVSRAAAIALSSFVVALPIGPAWAQVPAALAGTVSSTEEGTMEGVLVTARKTGSTMSITVVTGKDGRYAFPVPRLDPGHYDLTIRAVGYDLEGRAGADVATDKTATADLNLRKTEDLAAQMTNAEWVNSVPGTDQQKTLLLNCVGCHKLERVARSKYTAQDFLTVVLPRMQGYVNQSIPAHPQLRHAERLMEERGDQRVQIYRAAGEFLSKFNLSSASQWSYPLKTMPRPTGRATQVITTEYDLPRETIEPHDVVVDVDGIAWYSSFGEQFLGRLDPRTGKVTEFPIKDNKPEFPTGSLGLRTDRDGNLWLGNMYQATIVKFDRKAETFQYWPLPKEQDIDAAQVNMVSPQSSQVDGKVWTQNNGFAGVHRLDIATGRIETWEPFKTAPKGEVHNIYDVVPDSANNAYFTDFRHHHIGRIDAKTGEIKLYAAPTANSSPRRATMDDKDRLWFAEYRGNRIGVFDTKAATFKEWEMPTPWSAPYDVVLDKQGMAWTGSMLNDRISRFDPSTGKFVEYLLPRNTNVRRVFVDNTTMPVTFWAGSNHGASIVKLEPLD